MRDAGIVSLIILSCFAVILTIKSGERVTNKKIDLMYRECLGVEHGEGK